jgi:hypothetical protein
VIFNNKTAKPATGGLEPGSPRAHAAGAHAGWLQGLVACLVQALGAGMTASGRVEACQAQLCCTGPTTGKRVQVRQPSKPPLLSHGRHRRVPQLEGNNTRCGTISRAERVCHPCAGAMPVRYLSFSDVELQDVHECCGRWCLEMAAGAPAQQPLDSQRAREGHGGSSAPA